MSNDGKKMCGSAGCLRGAAFMGVCQEHWERFYGSPEFARVRTAISDWLRRTELERQHGGKQL